ncbi:MAG: hypothetical protein JRG95_03525 [Deltaproteobacteria bacterium]|nr:hypothetical protein [Deltaproteobacteria bacterium]
MRNFPAAMILMLLVVSSVEGISFFGGLFLEAKGVFYAPQVVEAYDRYERLRHPVTGWPPTEPDRKHHLDETGSRFVPAFRHTRVSCLSLYGDSFTYSAEVDDEHAWGNVLARKLGCRVSNFGIGGFGTDQAYLRYLHSEPDGAPVVLLGHTAENIVRNSNQLRGLVAHGTEYGLKPRFVLDGQGGLKLIPLPTPSEAEFRQLVVRPSRYLKEEYFLPGGSSGNRTLGFPYSLAVFGAFRNEHIVARVRGEPRHSPFYAADHPTRGLEVTARIMEAFAPEAGRLGQRVVLAILPTGRDLEYFNDRGRWIYESLIKRLEAVGPEVAATGRPGFDAGSSPDCTTPLREFRGLL